MKLLKLEFFKCRRRKVLLICTLCLLFQLAWIGYCLSDMDTLVQTQGWMLLLYNLCLIDAIMLPITVAAIASRNCEIEHVGHTFKQLETVMPPSRLFSVKAAWGAVIIGGMLLLRLMLFAVLGRFLSLPAAIPWVQLWWYCLISFGIAWTLYLLEESLALLFPNQAICLITGIVGSFAGLLSLFFPQWVQKILIWGYFGILSVTGMHWDPVTRDTSFYWVWPPLTHYLLLIGWFVAIWCIGRSLFRKKEV